MIITYLIIHTHCDCHVLILYGLRGIGTRYNNVGHIARTQEIWLWLPRVLQTKRSTEDIIHLTFWY
jgi:hypothetical protein